MQRRQCREESLAAGGWLWLMASAQRLAAWLNKWLGSAGISVKAHSLSAAQWQLAGGWPAGVTLMCSDSHIIISDSLPTVV